MVYVGCVLIIMLSAYFGKMFSDKYVVRDKFYRHLTNMCLFFKTNIGFNHTKLEKLFDEFEENNSQDFYTQTMFLKKSCIQSGLELFESKECNDVLKFIPKEERKIILSKIKNFGISEEKLEIEKIEDFMNYTNQKLEEYREERKKMQPLCYKLSLAVGLVICILLI